MPADTHLSGYPLDYDIVIKMLQILVSLGERYRVQQNCNLDTMCNKLLQKGWILVKIEY